MWLLLLVSLLLTCTGVSAGTYGRTPQLIIPVSIVGGIFFILLVLGIFWYCRTKDFSCRRVVTDCPTHFSSIFCQCHKKEAESTGYSNKLYTAQKCQACTTRQGCSNCVPANNVDVVMVFNKCRCGTKQGEGGIINNACDSNCNCNCEEVATLGTVHSNSTPLKGSLPLQTVPVIS